jgi:hypothetical protein
MNQSKFSLADVLTLLAALAFGFVCFLGKNFASLGNTRLSIIWAIVAAVSLFGFAMCAILLKRINLNFKSLFKWEMIFLSLFTVSAAFFSYTIFPHYYAVSGQRTEIQKKLSASIAQAEEMFAAYEHYAEERKNLYSDKLRSVAAAKNINPGEYAQYSDEYARYGFISSSAVSDDRQIENKMFVIHADLFSTVNYEAMKEEWSRWMPDARGKVENWKPIGIVGVVNKIEISSKDWLGALVNLSKVREMGEQANDFEYNLTFADVKQHFTVKSKPTLLSAGLAVAAYLIMLFSYLRTKRKSGSYIGIRVAIREKFGKKPENDSTDDFTIKY